MVGFGFLPDTRVAASRTRVVKRFLGAVRNGVQSEPGAIAKSSTECGGEGRRATSGGDGFGFLDDGRAERSGRKGSCGCGGAGGCSADVGGECDCAECGSERMGWSDNRQLRSGDGIDGDGALSATRIEGIHWLCGGSVVHGIATTLSSRSKTSGGSLKSSTLGSNQMPERECEGRGKCGASALRATSHRTSKRIIFPLDPTNTRSVQEHRRRTCIDERWFDGPLDPSVGSASRNYATWPIRKNGGLTPSSLPAPPRPGRPCTLRCLPCLRGYLMCLAGGAPGCWALLLAYQACCALTCPSDAKPLNSTDLGACNYGTANIACGILGVECSWTLNCVCKSAKNTPGAKCVRGCLQCLSDGALTPNIDAHLLCRNACIARGLWGAVDDHNFDKAVEGCIKCPDPLIEAYATLLISSLGLRKFLERIAPCEFREK